MTSFNLFETFCLVASICLLVFFSIMESKDKTVIDREDKNEQDD